jgi:flagellar hook-length control protein FliK
MIVLEPAPAAPRRSLVRAEGNTPTDAEAADAFDAALGEADSSDGTPDPVADPIAAPLAVPLPACGHVDASRPGTTPVGCGVAVPSAPPPPARAEAIAEVTVEPGVTPPVASPSLPAAAADPSTAAGAIAPPASPEGFRAPRGFDTPGETADTPVPPPPPASAGTTLPAAPQGDGESAPRPTVPMTDPIPLITAEVSFEPAAVPPTAPSPPHAVLAAPGHRTDLTLVAGADPRPVCAQIAVAVSASDDSRVEIRLDPPELGRVHIHLTTTDAGVQATVAAQRPETQDFLRRHADSLAEELASAGYGEVSLDFAAGGDAPSGHDDRPAADWRAFARASAEPTVLAGPRRGDAPGGLDIRL